MNVRIRSRLLIAAPIAIWGVAALTGMLLLGGYKATAGTAGTAAPEWPAGSALAHAPGRPTLLMFAHPRCPCTRASVAELARLMARVRGRVDARVLFTQPQGQPDAWVQGDTWQAASAIPGVQVAVDPDGAEGRRFGAETSGWTVLYDADGRLVFRGGITASRGHEGDNAGRDRLLALLGNQPAAAGSTPVFGCAMIDED